MDNDLIHNIDRQLFHEYFAAKRFDDMMIFLFQEIFSCFLFLVQFRYRITPRHKLFVIFALLIIIYSCVSSAWLLWSVPLQHSSQCDPAVCLPVLIKSPLYLLAGFPWEHMPLSAEVLPQLLDGSCLSGQPEAQRGLWILCEGTEGLSSWFVCVNVSGGKDAVYLDNAAGPSMRVT